MSATIMDSYKEYIRLYNQYRQSGDNASAIRVGRKIVEIADAQCNSPQCTDSYKTYYQSSSAFVREFLAEISLGRRYDRPSDGGNETAIHETDWFADDIPNLTMRDVAGLSEVRDEFMVNIFAPLSPKYAPIYQKYRRDVGLQILLFGPPGTGKTHLVKCLSGQLGCKVAVVKLKDALAGIVGDGAKILDEIFRQSREHERCIIFFDEIDSIAASRDDEESRHTKEQLTTLLTCMDGFTAEAKPGQVRIIVAATNRPWVLDSAIKRGGRFETQIYVPLPDMPAREKLVALALGKDLSVKSRLDIPCAPDVTVEWLAQKLDGYSGADIKAICKQIVNRPLKREIEYKRRNNQESNDCVTRQDCEEVIGTHIHSITDMSLFMYDAYAANMELPDYLKLYEPKAREARERGEALPPYVLRWLKGLDECKA